MTGTKAADWHGNISKLQKSRSGRRRACLDQVLMSIDECTVIKDQMVENTGMRHAIADDCVYAHSLLLYAMSVTFIGDLLVFPQIRDNDGTSNLSPPISTIKTRS